MGFYGNIANTSKTTFSFDLIYSSRWQMDKAAETDGVFLGRYVLVQYDAVPIKAYYNSRDRWMYNSYTFNSSTKIANPTEGQLYQDIANTNSIYGFYVFKNGSFQGITSATESPYAYNFQTDVKEYGRGYDSTVWMKQFNPESGDYKYVMMAELNAVVPTFHLVLDAPSEAPIAPYFDRDSTNIDYYLHMQPQYGVRVAKKDPNVPSDEVVTRKFITWTKTPESGRWDWNENVEEGVAADIYYNAAGFKHDIRTENIDVNNTINYTYQKSGRRYGLDPESSVWDQHEEKEDTYEWYFRLPIIGNSICYMWDKVYGLPFEGNNDRRNLNESQVANDTKDHLVTYDRSTLIGMLNTMRDMLGYHFIPYDNAPIKENAPDAPEATKQKITDRNLEVVYTPPVSNGITWDSVGYPALKCLYYKLDDQGAVTDYYHYAYSPKLLEFTGTTPSPTTTYYYADGRVANVAMLDAKTANNGIPAGAVDKIYYAQDAWELEKLEHNFDDSVYSLLLELHKLIGTNAEEVRDFNSIRGSINIMKDLLGSINLNLAPGRLVHTNVDTGVIETTDTYFPGSVHDVTRVLDGTGAWVNRIKTITIGVGESESTDDISTVQNKTIEADNDNNNNITIDSGNKWIRFDSDGEQHITVAHYTQAPQDTPAYYNLNDNTNNVPTKESFDTQTVAWDEAGHIKSYVTTTYDLPKSYKYLMVTPTTEDEEPVVTAEPVIADYTTDTLNFLPGNKWINLASNDGKANLGTRNQIIYSHKLSGVEEGSYGLASTETITTLDEDNTFEVPYYTVDKAGHITESVTHTVTIPENFEKVVLEVSEDTNETEMTAKAGEFIPTVLTDTITFGTKNKWIRAATEGKRIDFAHRLSPVTPTVSTQDLEHTNSFTVPSYEFDPAGHLIGKDTKTLSMPFAYKVFKVGTKVNAVTNNVSHVTGDASPDTFDDEFTFYNGNKWIDIAMNRAGDNSNVDDSLTFSHSVLHTEPISKGVTVNETPKFGDTFTVPSATIDEAGHVTTIADHTVEIPTPSMTITEGNVVVNTEMEPTTCAIEVTRVNVGTLALNEYVASTTDAPADVAATDTINVAFAKLQKQMNEEEAARAKAIEDEAKARSDADTAEAEARKKADDNEAKARADADTEEKEAREKAIEDEAKARQDADTAEKEAREKAINDEINARNDAIGSAINTEITNRNNAIKDAIDTEVTSRNDAIKQAIDDLTNGASEGYDTLKELEDLLNQETTTATVLVNLRTDLTDHMTADNPHKIDKEDIGLDKVENETKAEMFASAEFMAAVESILRNFTMSLAVPLYNITQPTESSAVIELEEQEGEVSIIWYKKQLDSNEFVVAESVAVNSHEYEAKSTETAGTYHCKLIRTYMGHTSEVTTANFELVYVEPVPEPDPEESITPEE